VTDSNSRLRLSVIGVIIGALFCGLLARLWFLQIGSSNTYAAQTQANRIRTVTDPGFRGQILDRNGVPIVQNQLVDSIEISRGLPLSQLKVTVKNLATLLNTTETAVWKQINNPTLTAYQPIPIAWPSSAAIPAGAATTPTTSSTTPGSSGTTSTSSGPTTTTTTTPAVSTPTASTTVPYNALVYIKERPEMFPGVIVTQRSVRKYLFTNLDPASGIPSYASQLLGYVGAVNGQDLKLHKGEGYNGFDVIGKDGVEQVFESELRGTPHTRKLEVNSRGQVVRVINDTPAKSGNDLKLTMDVNIQKVAEDSLQQGILEVRQMRDTTFKNQLKDFSAPGGSAVVLDARDGSVVAMASNPTFDVTKFTSGVPLDQFKTLTNPASNYPLLNRATQGLYPPGSTFKTVTAAAALDDGVFTPNSIFHDPGYCTEYGKPVSNALDQSGGAETFGNISLFDAYVHSVNAVYCMIGQKLGAGRILNEAKKFGFYSVPPLETPSDARSPSGLYQGTSLFNPKNPDTQVDPGRLAFGQERMLVTPLQMALVAATIANGGATPRPTLIKRVETPGGSVVTRLQPHVWKQGIKPATAAAIRDMMVQVVQRGTGTAAQIPGVTVAGKTGTAELAAGSNVYDAWFIFFAPAVNPVVAGAVVVENQANGFGGAIAAPIAKAIMQAILPTASNGTP
jgi:cell division protein FtsI/penicillin-binding protein 2